MLRVDFFFRTHFFYLDLGRDLSTWLRQKSWNKKKKVKDGDDKDGRDTSGSNVEKKNQNLNQTNLKGELNKFKTSKSQKDGLGALKLPNDRSCIELIISLSSSFSDYSQIKTSHFLKQFFNSYLFTNVIELTGDLKKKLCYQTVLQ